MKQSGLAVFEYVESMINVANIQELRTSKSINKRESSDAPEDKCVESYDLVELYGS
jgi:hypothetical protein